LLGKLWVQQNVPWIDRMGLMKIYAMRIVVNRELGEILHGKGEEKNEIQETRSMWAILFTFYFFYK